MYYVQQYNNNKVEVKPCVRLWLQQTSSPEWRGEGERKTHRDIEREGGVGRDAEEEKEVLISNKSRLAPLEKGKETNLQQYDIQEHRHSGGNKYVNRV